MAVEVILPRVDMDMETGKFTQWFVEEGASVAKGQALFEIETDKAAMEVDAPESGVLRGVTAKPGDQLPVGTTIGWICAPGEVLAAVAAPLAVAALAPAEQAPAPQAVAPAPLVSGGLRATPMARRLGRERGIDLSALKGTGPAGRVQARDIEARPGAAVSPLHSEWFAKGEGAPLVFVHGFGADLAAWKPLLARLPSSGAKLGVDLPGHGRSPLGEAPRLESFADALGETLAGQGVQAAHFVAHSLGAAVAATLAARRPGLALSLTLLAPAGLGPEIHGPFFEGFLRAASEDSLWPWLRWLAVDPVALGEAMARVTLRQRRELGVGETQARVAAALFPDGVQAFDIRAALAAYEGPTKVIAGREDRLTPAGQIRDLPGAVALHLLPGVGHMPHFEARETVARLVLDNVGAGEARRR